VGADWEPPLHGTYCQTSTGRQFAGGLGGEEYRRCQKYDP
jgi:hypothetical protein